MNWTVEQLSKKLAEGNVTVDVHIWDEPRDVSSHYAMQKDICDWAILQGYPLDLLYAIPNGQYRPGQRKEPGLRAGVPDLHLPVARRGYHSLYIEMKYKDNQLSEDQRQWGLKLMHEGHAIYVMRSVQAAQGLLRWYAAGPSDRVELEHVLLYTSMLYPNEVEPSDTELFPNVKDSPRDDLGKPIPESWKVG